MSQINHGAEYYHSLQTATLTLRASLDEGLAHSKSDLERSIRHLKISKNVRNQLNDGLTAKHSEETSKMMQQNILSTILDVLKTPELSKRAQESSKDAGISVEDISKYIKVLEPVVNAIEPVKPKVVQVKAASKL